jgi:hypothetical protein
MSKKAYLATAEWTPGPIESQMDKCSLTSREIIAAPEDSKLTCHLFEGKKTSGFKFVEMSKTIGGQV